MSDTHLNQVTPQFEAVCERFCRGADLVIHLGDWTSATILDLLQEYPLQGVAGNTDGPSIHGRLPIKKEIGVNRYRIGLIHGWGSARDLPNRLKNQFCGVDAIFFGHTHLPLVCEANGIFWFNPGSVFLGRGEFSGTIGVVHIEDRIRGEIIVL